MKEAASRGTRRMQTERSAKKRLWCCPGRRMKNRHAWRRGERRAAQDFRFYSSRTGILNSSAEALTKEIRLLTLSVTEQAFVCFFSFPSFASMPLWDELANEIPIITRVYAAAAILVTAACSLDLLSPFSLFFSTSLVFEHLQVWKSCFFFLCSLISSFSLCFVQLWRLLTSFFFFAPSFSLDFIFLMFFFVRYSASLGSRMLLFLYDSPSNLSLFLSFLQSQTLSTTALQTISGSLFLVLSACWFVWLFAPLHAFWLSFADAFCFCCVLSVLLRSSLSFLIFASWVFLFRSWLCTCM